MLRYIFAFGLVLGMSALGGPVFGQTPDGDTPAVETVCDRLTGAAFGLCNAYCEAQDCDVHERESCERLRDNFERKTGSRFFPCDPLFCEGLSGSLCRAGICPPEEKCESVTRVVCPDTGLPCDPACESLCVGGLFCECFPRLLPCDEADICSEGGCPPGIRCVTADPAVCLFGDPCPACICEGCECGDECEVECPDTSTVTGFCQDNGGDNCSCDASEACD